MPTKRRASAVVGPQEAPVRFPKRQRFTAYVPETNETPEQTTKIGLDLLEKIKDAKDKFQNPIAPEFLQLPDRNEYPEYYTTIRLPIAMDMVERKLRNHEYSCLTLLEADLRRMVTNAKSYNIKGSAVFSNAERIRKIVSAVMMQENPAYKDDKYVPFSAPVPDADEEYESGVQASEPPASQTDRSETRSRQNGRGTSHRTPTTDRDVEANESVTESFEGDTFEQAQERIISEMIRLKDEDGEEIYFPFLNKPDRNLYKEYYDIIKHPTSLRAILKGVRGTNQKKNPTKSTAFKTWNAFAEEVSYIWRNAREFNEDGSSIFELAGDLEKYFHQRLKEARRIVPEPTAAAEGGPTRIKLRVGSTKTPEPNTPKLTLKFPGGAKSTDKTVDKQHPGVTVDSESLKRQQALVRAGSGGMQHSPPTTSTRILRERAPPPPKNQMSPQREAIRPITPGGKLESKHSQSPRIVAPNTAAPNEAPRHQVNGASSTPATTAQTPKSATPATPVPPVSQVTTRKSSAPGQPVAGPVGAPPQRKYTPRSQLITHINIRTENGSKFNLNIPLTSVTSRQSVTLSVPFSHNVLYLRPTVVSSSLDRQTQLTVTVGSQKIPSLGPPVRSADFTIPRYELRLGPGVTKIDVEMYAAVGRGLAAANGQNVEYEVFTIFIHVMHK